MPSQLQNMYLFRDLDSDDLALIENIVETRVYAEGDKVFTEGEPADAFFVIERGSVEIELKDEDGRGLQVPIASFGTGSHFGEMSLIDNTPRSATATATSDSHILRIDYREMLGIINSESRIALHIYREFSRFLCSRLRLTTLDLSYERSQNLGHL